MNRNNKQLLADAQELIDRKCPNGDGFASTLELCFAIKGRVESMRRTLCDLADAANALEERATEYALRHTGALNAEPLHETRKGARAGKAELNGTEYTLTLSHGPVCRIDGGSMTAEFIARLPGEWVRTVPKLDVEGMNRLGVTEDDLRGRGLERPELARWTKTVG